MTFLVCVPRLVQRQTFAMKPATALCVLLLVLGSSETKRTAGKASSVLVPGAIREGGNKNKKLWWLCRQMKLYSMVKTSKGRNEQKCFNLSIRYLGTGNFSLVWNLCILQKQERRVSRT